MLEYVKCGLCGADGYDVLLRENIESGEKLAIVKCKKCGLIYTNPRLSTSDILKLYSEGSYAEKSISGLYCLDECVNRNRFKNCLSFLGQEKNRGGKLLDVGCGAGLFLGVVAKTKKWDIYGIETSAYAYKEAQAKLGKTIINNTLGEANFGDGFFDVITFWNVLEHVSNPLFLLREARRTLRDDGFVILTVPNVNFYLIKYFLIKLLFQKKISWYPNEHLYHFSVKSFKKLVDEAGFVVCKQVVSTPFLLGGSFENLIKRFGFVALKILFRCTGINLGGIEFYLIKSPTYN